MHHLLYPPLVPRGQVCFVEVSMADLSLQFLGAAGTVTGSKYLISHDSLRILVDCGMFQGERSWRVKNWDEPTFDVTSLDAVLITHAHVDHIGMLPRFYKLGLRCPVFCSPATRELARLILLDSARLQEEETLFRLEHGKSRHTPPLPLYTEADAQGALELLHPIQIMQPVEVVKGVRATWTPAGHILGACSINLSIANKKITFSGDLGRYTVPILKDPVGVEFGDLLLIESTYGDRLHSSKPPTQELAAVINRTYARKGVVVIPAFAVGRTQTLLYYLRELKEQHQIPDIPIVVDSPMASDATSIYAHNPSEYDEESTGLLRKGHQPFSTSHLGFTRDRHDSIKLNSVDQPMIIISASGMLTGGRILHHLRHRVSDARNTILFVGFQPPGSRGDWLKKGSKVIRILGEDVRVNAEIAEISGLSAHGDKDELLKWCRSCSGTPKKVAVVHGEPESAAAFANSLREEFKWNVVVPAYLEKIVVE